MRLRSVHTLSLSALLVPAMLGLSLAQSLHAQTTPAAPAVTSAAAPAAYESNPKFVEAMANAKKYQHGHHYDDAFDEVKKANKIAGGSCVKCLDTMYALQMGMSRFKEAAATARQLSAAATTPMAKSMAEGDLGHALLLQAGKKPKPAQLDEAHAALQAAIADFPRNLGARYTDGCVLAHMGRNADAYEQFAACAKGAAPGDPTRVRAQHFAENPALSLEPMAPAFEVTAADGSKFNLDNMTGRVVLIDFWATWCGPCNQELPHLQKLVKQFAAEPLTVISISWDSDETKWKDFIAKHEMTWVQYRDVNHSLTDKFGVPSIPHYFLIDSDGVMYPQMLSADDDVSGKLKKFLARAKAAKPTTTQVASSGS